MTDSIYKAWFDAVVDQMIISKLGIPEPDSDADESVLNLLQSEQNIGKYLGLIEALVAIEKMIEADNDALQEVIINGRDDQFQILHSAIDALQDAHEAIHRIIRVGGN